MNPSFIYSNKKTWLIVAICFLLILENVHHFKLKGQSRINCRIKTKLTYILFNPPPQKKYIYGSNVKIYKHYKIEIYIFHERFCT